MIIFSYDMPLRQRHGDTTQMPLLRQGVQKRRRYYVWTGTEACPGEPEKTVKDLLLVMSQKIYTF